MPRPTLDDNFNETYTRASPLEVGSARIRGPMSAGLKAYGFLLIFLAVALPIGLLVKAVPLAGALLLLAGVVALWLIVPAALLISILPHERFPTGTKWIADWFKKPPRSAP